MAGNSLDHSRLTLNLSLDQYDVLMESIAKARALSHVILLVPDLEQVPNRILHDYFWILSDLISDIGSCCNN